MNTIHETQVLVVGAGAVGCSIAYWLAKRGKDVTIVDKEGPGAGTSTANAGMLLSHIKEPLSYMELSLHSVRLWPKMVEELAEDVELRHGALWLCMNDEDLRKRLALLERYSKSPLYKARMLSPQEIWDMQPGLSKKIPGATFGPDDGDCNPLKWTYALARAARRKGVKFLTDHEVTGFALDDRNAVTGVLTRNGHIGCSAAVNAAGPWATQLAAMVGVNLGLYPQRGQMFITDAAPLVLPVPMAPVSQSLNGQFRVGVTVEDGGYDWSTSVDAARRLAKGAIDLVPAIRTVSVIRQFAGVRAMPRDGVPFIGPIPHVPGYYVATGHSGITLSPIHGKIISDLIVDGKTDLLIEDFDPLRYDSRGTRKASGDRKAY